MVLDVILDFEGRDKGVAERESRTGGGGEGGPAGGLKFFLYFGINVPKRANTDTGCAFL
jgi:hypothetical protein